MTNKISATETLVLQYYSLFYEPLDAKSFGEFIDHLDFITDGGLGYPKNKLNEIKKSLVAKGILCDKKINYSNCTIFCSNEEMESFTKEAIKKPWLNEAINYTRIRFPVSDYYTYTDHWKESFRNLRDLRLNIYLNRTSLNTDIENALIKKGLGSLVNNLYYAIFFAEFNADFLKNYPIEFQRKLLKAKIEENFNMHLFYDDIYQYIKEFNVFPDFQASFEGTLFLLKGEFGNAQKILQTVNTYEASISLAVIFYINADYEASKKLFEKSFIDWRKLNNLNKGFQDTWQNLIYGLCLLKIDRVLFVKYLEQYTKSIKQKEIIDNVSMGLEAIDAFLKDDNDYNYYCQQIDFKTLSGQIIKVITASYIKELNFNSEIKEIGSVFLEEGFDWLCFEWANCALNLNHTDAKTKQNANSIILKSPFKSIESHFPKEHEWEKTLNQLNLVIETNIKLKADKESRIVWHINFRGKDLQPLEQKKTKTGWTSGRKIALKRLFEKNVENMLAQDVEAINQGLEMHSYGYYGSEEYDFDFDKTILALIGHPNLFLFETPAINIELVKTEPNLFIKNVGNDIEIFFDRKITNTNIVVEKETSQRYNVFKPNVQQFEIAKVLKNKKLLIPKSAKDLLLNVIKPLAANIPVQSDLEEHFEDLPMVAADSILHGLIIPNKDGFLLELFVKPFEIVPPYLKPGKGQEIIIADINGTKTRTKRNIKEEKLNLSKLESACLNLFASEYSNLEWEIAGVEDCLKILEELEKPQKDNILKIEWPKGQKLTLLGSIHQQSIAMKVSSKGDWFEIKADAKVNEKLVLTFQQLSKLMSQTNGNFIELSEGQFIAITEKLRKKIESINNLMDDKQKMHFLRAEILEDFSKEIGSFKSDKTWKEHINKLENARKYQPVLPKTFEADLRPYQLEGFNWLASLANWGVGACLADDMGLGKTVQALALLTQRAEIGPGLVVAPVSVCRNWIKEAARFSPTLSFQLFGEGDRKVTVDSLGAFDVLVVSYSLLQSEEDLFKNTKFATILLDEAQAIKNKQTKRSKAVMNLEGDFKMVTTGTPIENHLGELWNLFNFLNPSMLGSYDFFQERFAIPIEKFNDTNKRQALQKLIKPFILRRRKNQVLDDLPSKTEIMLTVTLTDGERAFYEALRRNAVENLEQNDDKDKRFKILAELTRLRLACCHPKLVNSEIELSSSKLELFGETIDELIENNHKALVFSQFTKHLHIVEDYLKSKKIKYHYLDGSIPSHIRQERIDAFQKGDGDVFLISLKAGGTGLNLTAADYVIHLDPWWNPAVEDQASDRAHRMGQQRPVTVYRLVTENTIEEKILKLHETKRDLADSLLEGTDSSSKLSVDDLLNLIKEV
jgi:SNF2 family DNA or RNA helicase